MDEKANGDEGADARMGMIQVNDLVYKLDTDMSVAINRTHKIQFFQNQTYTNLQTSIAIVNSGADYIDPRRSFLSFDVVIPTTDLGANTLNSDYRNAFISAYFGKNGSVCNLIDSVVISTRSGDELSRVNDFGQLMNQLIPETFGQEWRDSIGQEIGLGSFLGGNNNSTYPAVPAYDSPNQRVSEQRRQRFAIPLYLVAPIFNYGRLLPSMLMSGLRIEIKWKPLDVACQQFWEGFPQEIPSEGPGGANYGLMDNEQTEFKTYLGTSTESGDGALDNVIFPNTVTYELVIPAADSALLPTLTTNAAGLGWNRVTGTVPDFQPGDIIGMSNDATPAGNGLQEMRFVIAEVESNTVLRVHNLAGVNAFTARAPIYAVSDTVVGAWRLSQRRQNGYQRDFGAPALHSKFNTPTTYLRDYQIINPQISMCAVQLTDAIQRTLNEFSSVNGLEIVYADYDRTSVPVQGNASSVYAEVRKSASRALCAFARVVQNTTNPHRYDSFASAYNVFWTNYQWQLGSLYFPQQRVEAPNSDLALQRDNVLALMYSYTQDAFDRYHPKAAPTMVSMRGTGVDFNKIHLHPTEVHAEHSPSTYLAPYSSFGKWGSFVNGATTVATTLERSSLFDLSGIPINNSRVLALKGDLDLSAYSTDTTYRALLFIFLKYVRLARVFLVNCEVEQ